MSRDDWQTPTDVTDLQMAFPVDAFSLMPPYDECLAALKELPARGEPWIDFQNRWFFHGLQGVKLTPSAGIDTDAALRHLAVIQRSYEPKHEYKEAAVAYLASRWFRKIKVPAATKGTP